MPSVLFVIAIVVLAILGFGFIYIIFINRVVSRDKAAVVNYAWSKISRVYTPKEPFNSSSYAYWPFLTEVIEIPLANIEFEFQAQKLNDMHLAPFNCKIACWISVEDPSLAVEKVDFEVSSADQGGFKGSVKAMLENQIVSTARSVAANLDLETNLIKDRKSLSNPVEEQINGDLEAWGLKLVKLDILDFSDADNSKVIQDLESIRQAQIDAQSRQAIAENDRNARVVEADSNREASEKEAEAKKKIELAIIESQKATLIAGENSKLEVAEQTKLANSKQVEAEKVLEVGQATNKALSLEEEAKGQKQALILKAQAEAESVRQTALAEAEKIHKIGEARATAVEKEAQAQAKFNEAGMELQNLNTWKEVMIAIYKSQAEALGKADTKISFINGTGGKSSNLFGLNLDPESGANLGQFIEAFNKTSPTDLKDLVNNFVKNRSVKKSVEIVDEKTE
jgi:uncharacterized membrane protein YqiK